MTFLGIDPYKDHNYNFALKNTPQPRTVLLQRSYLFVSSSLKQTTEDELLQQQYSFPVSCRVFKETQRLILEDH